MSENESKIDANDVQCDRKLCFIISAPRSGSTWISKALSHHPDIFCVENRFFGEYYDVVPNADGSDTLRITLDEYVKWLSQYYSFKNLDLNSAQFRRAMESALLNSSLELSYSFSNRTTVVDKITPYRNTADMVIKKIASHFPEATIVQLVRDGRDVMTSGVFDWIARLNKDHVRYSVFVERQPGAVVERFFTDEDMEQWTDEWAQPIRALASLSKKPTTIRYEAMKKNQASELRKFLEELGLSASSDTIQKCISGSTFEEMSGGRTAGDGRSTAKARKGVAGDWKNYFTRRDGELFLEKTGTLLVDMGYEKDNSWLDSLPEVLNLTSEITTSVEPGRIHNEELAIEIATQSQESIKEHSGFEVFLRKVFRRLTGFNLDVYEHQFPELNENAKRIEQRFEGLESYVNKIEDRVFSASKRLSNSEDRIQRALERLTVVEGVVEKSLERLAVAEGLVEKRFESAEDRIEQLLSLVQSNQKNTNERILAHGSRTGVIEKRFTDVEKRFKNIGERFEVFERRHHYADSRISSIERLLESVDGNPRAMWIFANRIERMDATLPFFDEKRRNFHLARYQFALNYIKGNAVADMACGTGYGSALLAQRDGAVSVTGVDIDPEAIEYAQEIHSTSRVSYLCESVDATGISENSMDTVVSFETIEHVDDDQGLVKEISRILKPKGMLICSTPNQWPLKLAPYHKREYNLESFREVLETKFIVKEMYNQNSGSESKFNHDQKAGIIATTENNAGLAECFIAICELK